MKTLPLIIAALMLAAAAHAQERSAGQSYDAQTNWAALKSSIDALAAQNKLIAQTVDAISSKTDAINTKMDAVADCGKQYKIWNGTACVSAWPAKLQTKTYSVAACSGSNDGFCQAKGYDSATGCNTVTVYVPPTMGSGGEGYGGGYSPGGYVTGYQVTCARLVPDN